MSVQATIEKYIDQNDFTNAYNSLKNEHGCISVFGGRYVDEKFVEINGWSDIAAICRKFFIASQTESFKSLPRSKLIAAENVIQELKRIYDETETQLEDASFLASAITIAYDLKDKFYDCYRPVDRLEEEVLPGLQNLIQKA